MQQEKELPNLRCPKCSNHGVYFRETKEFHYKCKKCGN